MSTTPDARLCPLCGRPNYCAMQRERDCGAPQPPCWCATMRFERAVLERIRPEARCLACICRACATARPPPMPMG